MTNVVEEFVLVQQSGSALPTGSQLLTRPLDPDLGRLCLVAVDADGQKHLLVEIGDEKAVADRSSQGVSLTSRTLLVGGKDVQFADLHCRIPALDLVFERLVEDVLKRLRERVGSPAGAVCRATLAEWRSLLKSAGQPMSRDTIVGVAGELVVLEALADLDPYAAVDAWKGPDGWSHDFASGRRELEVKSTASVDGNFVHISNIDQLDPSDLDSLHLVVVHLREDASGPTLDDRVRGLIERGVPGDVLLRKVADAGHVFESGDDNDMRLTVRSIRVWLVGDGFPGLRRSELAHRLHGISGVSYVVALDSAPKPLADEAMVLLADWLVHS